MRRHVERVRFGVRGSNRGWLSKPNGDEATRDQQGEKPLSGTARPDSNVHVFDLTFVARRTMIATTG